MNQQKLDVDEDDVTITNTATSRDGKVRRRPGNRVTLLARMSIIECSMFFQLSDLKVCLMYDCCCCRWMWW